MQRYGKESSHLANKCQQATKTLFEKHKSQ